MGLSPSSIGTLRGVSQAANQEILLKGFNMGRLPTLNNH
jgi:hypothetical protein